jgi:hypothetical protein
MSSDSHWLRTSRWLRARLIGHLRNRVLPVALGVAALGVAALCVGVDAQAPQAITVRMLDSKTGVLISTTNFLVRVDHGKEPHGDWIQKNEDGTGSLTLPAGTQVISIHATYDSATQTYSNCDVDKDRASADHAAKTERWYAVEAILTSGVVAPNDCAGKKVPERLQVVAKPGEFVFFVRPESSMEKMRD